MPYPPLVAAFTQRRPKPEKAVEVNVCSLEDISDGEMKEVAVDDGKVLIVRIGHEVRAIGAKCTHYGAPLVEGVLHKGRIICPWHHACFHAKTGAVLEPPALDSLPCYRVRMDGDDVFVDMSDFTTALAHSAATSDPDRGSAPAAADRVVAIIGAGAAGYIAAQTLRELGERGRIVLITREDRAPYDRPNLSKDYLSGHADPAWMPLRDEKWFDQHSVELERGRLVSRVSAADHVVKFDDGSTLSYSVALIATGGSPRALKVPGAELDNVFLLRSFDDSDAIIAAAGEGGRAVVIGASFIAMEAASSLRELGVEVTVVAPDKVPFERIFGAEVGAMLQRLHEDKGVSFRLGAEVERIDGEIAAEAVVMSDGSRLPTDCVVVGVGVTPATDMLEGVTLDERGGVVVDDYLYAGNDIYAAGDIASFPAPHTGERIRIEHWRTALQLGKIAARNIVAGDGVRVRFEDVPFFWTRQHGKTLQYVGHAREWDEVIHDGDVAGGSFIAYYFHSGRLVAAAAMDRPDALTHIGERLRVNDLPTRDELRAIENEAR